MRTRSLVLLLAFAASAAVVACEDDATGPDLADSFTVTMSGANERPTAVSPAGTGTATFTLNDAETALDYSISVEDMTSNITAAHIHLGDASVAGAVIVPLTTPVDGGTVSGSISRTTDLGLGLSWESLLALMRNGDTYVNVHTSNNPPGETRGQIEPAP